MSDDLIERHKKEMLFVEAGYGYGPALAEDMSITILKLRARLADLETKLREVETDNAALQLQISLSMHNQDAAEAALATARQDALEEVAQLVDEMQRRRQVVWPKDIRALIAQEQEPTT